MDGHREDVVGAPRRLVDRVPAWWLVGGLVVTVGATFVADVVWPFLVDDHPLALLVISSRARHTILVVTQVDLIPFVAVATVRLVVGDLFAFALGRRYGDRAIRYALDRSGRWAPHARRAVHLIHRSATAAVLLGSGSIVFGMVGATGMRPRRFLILDTLSTAVFLALTHVLGDAFSSPITAALEVFTEHRWATSAATSVALVAVLLWRRVRGRAAPGLLDAVEELEHGG